MYDHRTAVSTLGRPSREPREPREPSRLPPTTTTTPTQPPLSSSSNDAQTVDDRVSISPVGGTRTADLGTAALGNDHVKSVISGAAAGMATVVAGHPFDTIKVRMQTHNNSNAARQSIGMIECCRNVVRSNGIMGLYRGMASPLLAVTPRYAVRFWAYDVGLHISHSLFATHPPTSSSWIRDSMLAGALAAIPTTIVTTPTEQIKVTLQTRDGPPLHSTNTKPVPGTSLRSYLAPLPNGTGGAGLREEKGLRPLFRGTFATFARDVPGFAAYFVVYEMVHHAAMGGSGGGGIEEGGTGRERAWTDVQPPSDVIKSRIQSSPPGTYLGFTDAAKRLVRTEGLGSLFRGTAPALLRLVPANAAGFVARIGSLAVMDHFW
ncbi:mitochondrial carrier domain-containing protein [Fimicolochytrium jonesii]|uniref:mitochondrial carrier domain-containing protein n=1 Tax=Fimicolochytrium jonesii TaxID=1396493 RepID=UPI0022FDCC25|nr:mitochondrial carrier domain-containing protein [Fimicolochytrium jonesii]KAI8822403.1 mitochondrial carrier domain-containing protein [Fimicolochytrium jonesii]